MAELPTPTQVTDLVSLLAPGFIISAIRARAITGSIPNLTDRIVSYAVISTGYFAAVTPLFHISGSIHLPNWLWSFLQYFLVPVVLGIASAYFYQARVSYRLAGAARLNLAHHLPASWDFTFEGLPEGTYLLVTLHNGSQIAGRWSHGSFASSSTAERDLLLAEMWDIGDGKSEWQVLNPPRSILICGKDIRHVEIYGG